jgi:hypothetical protein
VYRLTRPASKAALSVSPISASLLYTSAQSGPVHQHKERSFYYYFIFQTNIKIN